MITANGKTVIKRFHAGQFGEIGTALAVGISAAAATVNDARLNFEVVRLPIASVSVDPDADRIVFRAILAPGLIKTIYEVGLWHGANIESGRVLNLSDVTNTWANGTLSNANGRANTDTVQVDYVANGTTNAELAGFWEDLSTFGGSDSLVVGYYATTNLSSFRIRLGSDSSNYFEFLMPAPNASAYNIARLNLSAATVVGSPSWGAINYLALRPSATAAGTGSIFFDTIRFERNPIGEGDLLVARSSLATPYSVNQTTDNDIEYSLRIGIS